MGSAISSRRHARQEFLDRQPTYWLKRSYQALRRRVDAELRPLGITLPQRDALLTLHHTGAMSMGELADSLGLEQSSASRLATGLLRRGLVTSRLSEVDKRSRILSISAPGVDVLETTPGATRVASTVLNGKLSQAETDELVNLLRKFAAGIEEQPQ